MFYPTEKIKISGHLDPAVLSGKYTMEDIKDPLTKKVILEAGSKLSENTAKLIIDNHKEIEVLGQVNDWLILNTLAEDSTHSHEDALLKIYGRLRPGMPPQIEQAKKVFFERFFDKQRYQMGLVGRFRLNRKFGLNIPESEQTLLPGDIINAVKYVITLRKGEGGIDDIDHLGNRRVRTIDELILEEIRRGFLSLKRIITERLNLGQASNEAVTPRTLVNSKPISSAISHFFEQGELSQVASQTNPLDQLTHERRLSALGPGGLNRKRAGFEVRDVHPSHYGRICPIETPEGANIGLISSMAIYSALDKYGFIVTPYYPVKKGRVVEEMVYLRADEEKDKVLVPADVLDTDGKINRDKILARCNGEFLFVPPDKVDYIDVSPDQMVGLSAGLIPFLEHNDANRALMGSNMQRQAVPLLLTEPPLIITGLEKHAAANSSMVVKTQQGGIVTRVTADQIEIQSDDDEASQQVTVYDLKKFTGLNERTCHNQKPIVNVNQRVKRGQIIADGAATAQGELAMGRNIMVAFMTWEGYNFEDAMIVNERLLKDDIFTSIHIEEFEVEARETKLGPEEFTRDIPNVSEKALKNLDESGIIRVGTKVKPGDILVGKITPKSKSELTPEEKLLHAIFGKAGEDVKNESLEVPPGVEGIIIDAQRFSRLVSKNEKEKTLSNKKIKKIDRDINARITVLLVERLKEIEKMVGKRLVERPISYGPRGSVKGLDHLKEKLNLERFEFASRKEKDEALLADRDLIGECEKLENEKELTINRLMRGDDLPTGVLEMVKIIIASKRRLSVGDKLAGRHGNKGVIAKILPSGDMPFLADGTPVDIILNPLGVPSRMNVGQILETHLGWAAKTLNFRALTPVFNGAKEEEITNALKEAGLPADGKTTLYDGRTGRSFDQKITIGYTYIMKLHHLVDDKIHARATGPYSLITQQPLGGKARYGGQRFGEMEVWALEGYGAANVLQEMLTVKSDDVDGRTKIYESMIKGDNLLDPGTPVSFEVLNNEIKGLCLNMKLEKEKKTL